MPHELPKSEHLKATCSFCKKNQDEVRQLVAGFGSIICDECVQLCHEIFSQPNDDPHELVLINRLQVSKLVTQALNCAREPITPEHFETCDFSIASGAYGAAPNIRIRITGKHKGRTFWFDLRAIPHGNEHGLVMLAPEIEAFWE